MFESLKLLHMACAGLTILFFVGRGIILLRDHGFVGKLWVRRTAQGIDSLLFISGVMLAWLSSQSPWQDEWLGAKIAALLLYILFGMVAFHWGETTIVRFSAWLMAVLTFVMIVLMAMAHSPWPF